MEAFRYFKIYKPYGMLSQFTREHPDHKVLGDLGYFPKDVYPVGRLDKDSEGLLLLTDNNKLKTKLLDPDRGHERKYIVQLEGNITETALDLLRAGVGIKVNKRLHKCKPAKVRILSSPPDFPERNPPIRFRKTIPDCWIELIISEGKNRQVRRMCAKVGFPVLRLVRTEIAGVLLHEMELGSIIEIKRIDILV